MGKENLCRLAAGATIIAEGKICFSVAVRGFAADARVVLRAVASVVGTANKSKVVFENDLRRTFFEIEDKTQNRLPEARRATLGDFPKSAQLWRAEKSWVDFSLRILFEQFRLMSKERNLFTFSTFIEQGLLEQIAEFTAKL